MSVRLLRTVRYTLLFVRLLARDRQLLFWTFGFFFVVLLVFLGPLSGGDAAVRIALACALVTIALMSNALFGMSVWVATSRDSGVFRQFRLTPARAGELLLAAGAARTTFVLAAAVSQVLVARLVFSVAWTGTVAGWFGILALGSAAFTAIGFATAARASSARAANRNVNLLLIPMIALGGAALPAAMLPEWWNGVRWLLPVAALQDGLVGAFVSGDDLWRQVPRLANLAAWMTVALIVGGSPWRRHA